MESLIEYLFRPKGITEIVFSDNLPTHIRFKWVRTSNVIVTLNKSEFERLSPELRFFVLAHELGHLRKLKIGSKSLTILDEDEADQFAFEECKKVGIDFGTPQNARKQYQAFIN